MESSNTLMLPGRSLLKVILTLVVSLYANLSFSQQLDLRTCGYNCTSNNYTLTDVFLSLTDVYGVPITNTTCTIGNVQQVYILLNYTSNANSNIYYTRFFADLSIDGVVTPLNVLLNNNGTIAPGAGQVHLYGPFNWTCGQELLLNNILVAWRTSANQDPGPNYTCNSYSNSQCDFSPNMVISKPLAVQFTYTGCTNGNQSTIQFTSTTNGGIPPYSYAWDFDNNGTTDSTFANPSHTYSLPGNYTAKLTVTDSQDLVNSYMVPIVFPSEIILSANITNLSCSGGNTGAIDLSVSGGTAPYTYLWSNGSTNQDISNLTAGSYTVTVKDALNCSKSATYVIAGGDTVPPVVTAPNDITLEGCNESAITALPFSDTEVVITLAQLQALGGNATDNSGGSLIISYIDVKSGSCPIVVTRTFYAKDACNNVGSDVQIINIEDTIAPSLPAVLPQNITVSCDNVPANSSLTANDNCSGAITVQGVDTTSSTACSSQYSISRKWTFNDACGNTSSHTQIITVQDTTKPVFNGQLPGDVTVQCDNVPAPAILTASDNCDNSVQVVYSETFAGQDDACSANYTITRNWSV
ncbi:PKD domain-containing protein, partial [Flavobacterium sp. GCM10023249]|uniref:HYR-like domain-containing protein n=1 Tax=unclassified Flavobacterium TaxID=196869 RepID=UPI00361018EC